jgi:hypothetical protein
MTAGELSLAKITNCCQIKYISWVPDLVCSRVKLL